MGVGADGGIVSMPTGRWRSSIATSLSSDYEFDEGVHVPITSLDTLGPLLVKRGERVLVKIDVEGTERAIFDSARAFFQENDVDILCEVLPGTDSVDLIEDVLREGKFNRFMVCDETLRLCNRVVPSKEFHDWIFSPRSVADSIHSAPAPIRTRC
jgi:hypothetical protein